MKLIFKIGKGDFFTEPSPNIIPQIGYTVKVFDKLYNVDSVLIDYDAPKENEIIIVQLSHIEPKIKAVNFVTVFRVWKQNAKSLTVGKVYEIQRRKDGKFAIVNDKGFLKWFKLDNSQFIE